MKEEDHGRCHASHSGFFPMPWQAYKEVQLINTRKHSPQKKEGTGNKRKVFSANRLCIPDSGTIKRGKYFHWSEMFLPGPFSEFTCTYSGTNFSDFDSFYTSSIVLYLFWNFFNKDDLVDFTWEYRDTPHSFLLLPNIGNEGISGFLNSPIDGHLVATILSRCKPRCCEESCEYARRSSPRLAELEVSLENLPKSRLIVCITTRDIR